MNKKFLTMAGVVAVLSAGTFWGLEIFKPHQVDEVKFPESVSVDQVFANKLDPNGASDQSVAAANTAAVTTSAGSDATAAPAEGSGTGSDNTAAAAPAAEAASPAAESSSSEATTAAAPAAAAASEAAVSEPAQASNSSPAASSEAAAESAPAATPDTTASAPTESSESAAAEPAPAEAAPVAKPAPAKKHVAHAAKPAHHAAVASSASAKHSRWWPAENPANLSLVYAGPASFKKAIVLMFNGAFFKTDGLDGNLKVTDKSGQPVSGSWEIGENNRRMLVFPVAANGQYKVSIGTGLTDSKGRKIAHSLSGPVTIR